MKDAKLEGAAKQVAEEFAKELNDILPSWEIKERPDGPFLIFLFAEPTDRMFSGLNNALSRLPDSIFFERCAIRKRPRKPRSVVTLPEARMLQKELSESLTVDRHTFGEEFASRYTPSVTDFEQSIIGNANYVVYGRRGSGKSSLLAYAMHRAVRLRFPFAWVALQTYAGRSDTGVVAKVVSEVLSELGKQTSDSRFESFATELDAIATLSANASQTKLTKILPSVRKLIAELATKARPLTVFLDDLHVLEEQLQTRLLSALYSLTRGNNSYIKVSGIEQFTNIWDARRREGLEPPHDAQILKLDHNLTLPDLSKNHIVSILDAHATYCGLPSIRYLANDDVLSRLVLVAAAVPRDALSLFSQAIAKSSLKGQKEITITAINAAASEAIEEKLRDVNKDIGNANTAEMRALLEKLRVFCIKTHHINAFLVRMNSADSDYKRIQQLIALRFVHILHEGITPHKVGDRFMALMLDFGFYIGIRAAKSVKLFPDTPRSLPAKELRKLPIFSPAA